MPVTEFRDNDQGFLHWLIEHPHGYVVNIQRNYSLSDARLHDAGCGWLTAAKRRGLGLTGSYVKVCANTSDELHDWVRYRTGRQVHRCGTCRPPVTTQTTPAAEHTRVASTPAQPAAADEPTRVLAPPRAPLPPIAPRAYALDTSRRAGGELCLRGDRYIPFERLTVDQREARDRLRAALSTLTAAPGQLLEAIYAGPKPANADVENLLLYNIDMGGASLLSGCQHGVRFEFAAPGQRSPEAPGGCSYRYRLVNASSQPTHWRGLRELASFQRAQLSDFPSAHRLAQTWRAIHQTAAETSGSSLGPGEPFGVFLTVFVPSLATGQLRPELVKSLVDGTVAAFQAQVDGAAAEIPACRVAAQLGEAPDHVREFLLDNQRAVLGPRARLVHPWRDGVQWSPGDHLCVVGQVQREETDVNGWSLSGQVRALAAI